ncbi:hypothetical protein RZS28_10580 [Methylocapsa polymorpha]|uniref:Phage holin family protein n=1 Tax=Methylocapsa polymorpha TaxID=3080828 RepID=A0ABZ0HNU7_9HYPH|nr:hypothetical protein RZS28_10580 [Methylocapsa sp. RX1]
MLIKLLKLFGFDMPAKINALTADLERRLEAASAQIANVAWEGAVILALSALAVISGVMAGLVGLIALYRWMAEAFGPYVALGGLALVLVAAALALALAAVIKWRSSLRDGIKLPRLFDDSTSEGGYPGPMISGAEEAGERIDSQSAAVLNAAPLAAPTLSARDLAEPLAFVLSKVIMDPGMENSMVGPLIETLGLNARETADATIDRAANVVRHGDRAQLVIILTGAAFVGWLLTRHPAALKGN